MHEADRSANSDKIRGSRYLNHAIIKYGQEVWDLQRIDTAYSISELNEKEYYWINEYDSTNPDKGYNLREGGDGRFINPETKELLREANLRQFSDPENIKIHSEITKDMWKNEEFRNKQELTRNSPEFKEKMRNIGAEKWQRSEYRKKMEKIMKSEDYIEKQRKSQKKRWNVLGAKEKQRKRAKNQWKIPEIKKKHIEARSDPDYKRRQSKALKGNRNAYKEIKDKNEFLRDVKNSMWLKDMTQKYDMSGPTIRERIRELFGKEGPHTLRELKRYLQNKNIDDVLKKINERESNKQDDKKQLEN